MGKTHERLQFLGILIFQCLFLVDCQWTDWSEWSCCSQTCTKGVRTRTRYENQTAQNGGKPCLGQKVESEIGHFEDFGKYFFKIKPKYITFFF